MLLNINLCIIIYFKYGAKQGKLGSHGVGMGQVGHGAWLGWGGGREPMIWPRPVAIPSWLHNQQVLQVM